MINQTLTDSFMHDMWNAVHAVTTDTLKLALYDQTASLGRQTTVYTTQGEIVSVGYTAGGTALANVQILFEDPYSWVVFDNPLWTGALSAKGALLYNASKDNKAICVFSFGGVRTSLTTFEINVPRMSPVSAVLRFKR